MPVGTYGLARHAPYHMLSFLLTKLPLNSVSYAMMRRYPKLLRRALAAIFADPNRVTPEILSEVEDVLRITGNGGPFSNFQRGETTVTGLRSVFTSELPGIRHPTMFIHGRKDSLVPLEAVTTAATHMPNARVEIMDTGHWPMRERPKEFNEIVISFLRGLA